MSRSRGKLLHHAAFATDDDLGGPPADIVQFQRDDLARAQTKSGKEKQDRIVPAPAGRRSIGCRQTRVYFFRREKGGRSGLAVFADPGNGRSEIDCQIWPERKRKRQNDRSAVASSRTYSADRLRGLREDEVPNRQRLQ